MDQLKLGLPEIEEFVAFKGAYEITSLLKNIDDAPYKSESLDVLNYCFENYNANYYIFLNFKTARQKPHNTLLKIKQEAEYRGVGKG